MRQVRFLAAFVLTFLLSSCNDELLIKDVGTPEQGMLSFSLGTDSSIVTTKADGGEATTQTHQDTLDNFRVEIYRKVSDGMDDGIRLYKSTYAESKDKLIPLDAGDYYLRAKFGDSLGIGFDRPFLMAEKEFTVEPQKKVEVSAVAKISNVKVSVNFGDYFNEYYPDYRVKVINNDSRLVGYKNSLVFEKDETRSGYIHHGDFTVEVYADFKGDGEYRYYQLTGIDADNDGIISETEKFSYRPNSHVTFNIDAAEKLYGNLLVNIKVDDGVNLKEYEDVVPEYKSSQNAPMASRQGFDLEVNGNAGYCYVYEGRSPEYNEGQSFSYSANAGVKSCLLTINSDYLKTTYGLADSYDLVKTLLNDGIEVNTDAVEDLAKAGIRVSVGQFMGIVDFTDAMKALGQNSTYVDDTTPCASFSLAIVDESGKTASTTGSMIVWPQMVGTMTIPDYDVWATKVAQPVVNLTKGKSEYCQLQFSEDGKEWQTVQEGGTVSGLNITFADHAGLEPSTSYWFRAYDSVGNAVVGDPVQITTEDALQLGNPSFEEFRIQVFSFYYLKYVLFGPQVWLTRYWYDLFNNASTGTQWATNSSASLDYEVTNEYSYYKCYPTVTLQKGSAADGDYSVMIASVATTDYGSEVLNGEAVTGEVFIGTADNSGERKGNHTSDGDEFTSRPSKLTFQHKFSQNDSDPYLVTVQVWDSSKNVIGSGSLSSGTSVEPDWVLAEVPITYTITNKKAAYIYVSFNSSATGSTESRNFSGATGLPNTHVEASGSSYVSVDNDPIHAGSILWVDDVNLVY